MSGCLFNLAWVRFVDTVVDMDAGVGGATAVKSEQHNFKQLCMNCDCNIVIMKEIEH